MTDSKHSSRLVYSSGLGKMCPDCRRPLADCRCKKATAPGIHKDKSAHNAIVTVSRQTRGRRGKGVTLISGIPLSGDALDKYAARLRKICGAGGAVKQQVVEIQGDHRDKLTGELEKQGWKTRRSGG